MLPSDDAPVAPDQATSSGGNQKPATAPQQVVLANEEPVAVVVTTNLSPQKNLLPAGGGPEQERALGPLGDATSAESMARARRWELFRSIFVTVILFLHIAVKLGMSFCSWKLFRGLREPGVSGSGGGVVADGGNDGGGSGPLSGPNQWGGGVVGEGGDPPRELEMQRPVPQEQMQRPFVAFMGEGHRLGEEGE